MDLGRNDLSRGGTTVATSSSSVVNARWSSSTPLPDFPISGNHFPISVILLISGYREIISWYREIISRYRKMRFISRYRELFPDIGKLNSRYPKIIPYFPISEIRIPDIGKSFPDIGKCWIKTQMAFHSMGPVLAACPGVAGVVVGLGWVNGGFSYVKFWVWNDDNPWNQTLTIGRLFQSSTHNKKSLNIQNIFVSQLQCFFSDWSSGIFARDSGSLHVHSVINKRCEYKYEDIATLKISAIAAKHTL